MQTTTTDNDDIRESLESSFDSSNLDSFNENTAVEPTPPVETGYSQEAAAPTQADPTEGMSEEQRREYHRDEKGKFAPKAPEQGGIKAAEKVGLPPGADHKHDKVQKDPLARAPEAWKPEAREFWKDIPTAAKQEIIRHNQLVYDTLQRTSEERKFAQAVQKTVAPFEHFIKAEGGNPIQAIDNLMSTAALLRTGTADQIANLVSQITNQFGIGRFGNQFIEKLDGALAGKVPPPENPQITAMRQQYEQEMAPLRQMQQQMNQNQQMAMQQEQMNAEQEIAKFEQQSEFLNDVRLEMADIMDMGARRGVNYTLKQAYDIACRANPEINKVIMQRDQTRVAQSMSQTAQRAKAAAVSVGGSPALGGNDNTSANSIRDAIEFAMDRSTR